MVLGILLLLSGLTISAVAIYYSVLGLSAIFAATLPIYIMGGALELSKLVAASWLKSNWQRSPSFLKWYMFTAVIILMLITSMGIFGFLSKTHAEHSLVTGENSIKLAEIERQISIEKRSIQDSEKVISQLDQVVLLLTNAERLRGENGAISVRKSQSAERVALNTSILSANKRIQELEDQKQPFLEQKLKIESEVGPIKYIAQFIYGDNPDANILEKAVTWVIILLVSVFDPLAVAMLLAAQITFKWNSEKPTASDSIAPEVLEDKPEPPETPELREPEFDIKKHPYLFKKISNFKSLVPMVYTPLAEKEESSCKPSQEPVQSNTSIKKKDL